MKKNIYHISTQEDWLRQEHQLDYSHNSLETEGFIHCSNHDQVQGVLDRYFKGMENLVKLTIDSKLLTSELKYESASNGEFFPHIYGPINKSAIIATELIK